MGCNSENEPKTTCKMLSHLDPPQQSQPNFCLDVVIHKLQCFLSLVSSTGLQVLCRQESHLHNMESSTSPSLCCTSPSQWVLGRTSYRIYKAQCKMKMWASLLKRHCKFQDDDNRAFNQGQDPCKPGALRDSTGHTPVGLALVPCGVSGSLPPKMPPSILTSLCPQATPALGSGVQFPSIEPGFDQ